MEVTKAREIITTLASGVNPATGEVLPEDSPYNEPGVIRALYAALESMKSVPRPKKTIQEKQADNLNNGRPKNAGLPWTDETRNNLSDQFRSGHSIEQLSRYFERTRGAIVSELIRQGLIDSGEVRSQGDQNV